MILYILINLKTFGAKNCILRFETLIYGKMNTYESYKIGVLLNYARNTPFVTKSSLVILGFNKCNKALQRKHQCDVR